jgi:hypothetical protein
MFSKILEIPFGRQDGELLQVGGVPTGGRTGHGQAGADDSEQDAELSHDDIDQADQDGRVMAAESRYSMASPIRAVRERNISSASRRSSSHNAATCADAR